MQYYDDFDDPQRRGPLSFIIGFFVRHGRVLALCAFLLAVGAFAAVLWATYPATEQQAEATVPIIRADVQSFKVSPDDPGGMEIPHRDSTVFASLRPSRHQQERRIENLLADDDQEDPVPRSQLFAGLNTESGEPADITEDVSVPEKQEEVTISATPQPETPKPVIEEKPKEATKPKPVSKPETKEKELPEAVRTALKMEPPPKAPIATGKYYIQLGSVKSNDGAKSEWKILKNRYASQLGAIDHRVKRADLGAKGTFYRIQAGPVSKDKAGSICNSIKAIKPGACLVVGE